MIRYAAKEPGKQEKVEELVGIRDAYRQQRRLWLWLMAVSFLGFSIILGRSGRLSPLLAFICLGVGLYPVYNFIKCTRAVRLIDKGLAPYKVEETTEKDT